VRERGPLAAFAAFGVFWGAWGALLPGIKEQTGITVGELGLALLFIAGSALPAMLLAGMLLDRFGPVLLPITGILFALAAVLPGFTHSLWQLIPALVVVGVTSGAFDVSINVAASGIEVDASRRIMQKAHGFFSGGFLVGSPLSGVAREAGADPLPILVAAAAVLLGAAWVNRDARHLPRPAPRSGPRFQFSPLLVLLGLLCAVAFVVESGIEHWSALFLESELGGSPALGALGPAFFAAAMVAGRAAGQTLEVRVGEWRLLGAGALLAAAGLALAAAAPSIPIGVLGFFIGGAGISVAAPTLFGAAGRSATDAERGSAIAAVTTVSYLGFLGGPPLVGGVSDQLGLRGGIATLAVVGVVLAVGAASCRGALSVRRPQPAERRSVPEP
jgi:MFS family permease